MSKAATLVHKGVTYVVAHEESAGPPVFIILDGTTFVSVAWSGPLYGPWTATDIKEQLLGVGTRLASGS